jgi:hypothetical protein
MPFSPRECRTVPCCILTHFFFFFHACAAQGCEHGVRGATVDQRQDGGNTLSSPLPIGTSLSLHLRPLSLSVSLSRAGPYSVVQALKRSFHLPRVSSCGPSVICCRSARTFPSTRSSRTRRRASHDLCTTAFRTTGTSGTTAPSRRCVAFGRVVSHSRYYIVVIVGQAAPTWIVTFTESPLPQPCIA